MKNVLAALALALGISLALSVQALAAGPGYGSSELTSTNCKAPKTPTLKVVEVNFRLINDYDSGVAGNAWANDSIHRQLQIWQNGPGIFCSIITDTGRMTTFAGASPSGAGTVTAGIEGTMSGGYRTGLFFGSLIGSPAYGTSGNLGTFNLNCSSAYDCPGARPTISSYISGYAGQLDWWGWQYATDTHGTWTNSVAGNSGDITG